MCVFQVCRLCSKTTCLLPSPADGVDEEVVGFLSHLKEFKQLRKVEMTVCRNLSPSLIATICEGLCSSNSMEEVEVTTLLAVSVLFVCLTTPYKLLSSVSKLPLKTVYVCLAALNRRQLLLPLTRGNPLDAVQLTVLFNTVLLCSLQFSPLQFCILCSLLRH